MAIKKDTLDDLLAGRDPKAVFSKDGLFDELKRALAERVLNAELDDHLDNEAAEGSRNRRNGSSKKTVLTETAKIDIRIPRDREGTFDPKLIQRYQRRFPGFDDKIVSMYARGMTVREIQGHLLELYGLEVSPDLISTVTDAVLETVAEWQNRPLETSYPLVFFDAIRVKIRDEGLVRNKAVYFALGVAADGTKDSRRAGERVMASVSRFLTSKLRLKVNEAKSAVARPEERKFLGFSISNDGSERRIAPKALDKFKGRIRDMTRRTRGFGLQQLIKELKPYIVGWRGYFGFCQTPRILTNLEAWIRRRLRVYLWRQWRTRQNRFAELRRRGITKFPAAVAAGSPTGLWRMSGHPAVQQAVRNNYFKSLGLPQIYAPAQA